MILKTIVTLTIITEDTISKILDTLSLAGATRVDGCFHHSRLSMIRRCTALSVGPLSTVLRHFLTYNTPYYPTWPSRFRCKWDKQNYNRPWLESQTVNVKIILIYDCDVISQLFLTSIVEVSWRVLLGMSVVWVSATKPQELQSTLNFLTIQPRPLGKDFTKNYWLQHRKRYLSFESLPQKGIPWLWKDEKIPITLFRGNQKRERSFRRTKEK